MTKEQLLELGLNEEQIKEVFRLNGIAVNNAKDEAETIKAENERLKEQLEKANTTIEEFKEMDIEGIKAAADEYKAKYEETENKYKEELEKIKFNHALDKALAKAKARNTKAVRALLDLDNLKLADDKILGLDEQLEQLRKENDFLFHTEEGKQDNPLFTRPSGGKGKVGLTKEDFERMGYMERLELKRKDPETYNKFNE